MCQRIWMESGGNNALQRSKVSLKIWILKSFFFQLFLWSWMNKWLHKVVQSVESRVPFVDSNLEFEDTIWSSRIGFLIKYNLTTWVKLQSSCLKGDILLSKKMSSEIWVKFVRCKFSAPPSCYPPWLACTVKGPRADFFLTHWLFSPPTGSCCVSPHLMDDRQAVR